MTEFQMIRKLCEIDEQLLKNKKHIDEYAGLDMPEDSDIWRLVRATKLLFRAKFDLQERLRKEYGVHYM